MEGWIKGRWRYDDGDITLSFSRRLCANNVSSSGSGSSGRERRGYPIVFHGLVVMKVIDRPAPLLTTESSSLHHLLSPPSSPSLSALRLFLA